MCLLGYTVDSINKFAFTEVSNKRLKNIKKIQVVFNNPEQKVIAQMENCLTDDAIGAIMGDSHYGYKIPVGGVIAYEKYISPSAVGFDIACGLKAVKTSLKVTDIPDMYTLLKQIQSQISFGVGRVNNEDIDHPVLDKIKNVEFEPQRDLYTLAKTQLGTVGSRNHFVDILKDDQDNIWVSCHFGSRGFGHKTAMGFIAISQGQSFQAGV